MKNRIRTVRDVRIEKLRAEKVEKVEKVETPRDPRVGTLVRKGRTVFYAFVGGEYVESSSLEAVETKLIAEIETGR